MFSSRQTYHGLSFGQQQQEAAYARNEPPVLTRQLRPDLLAKIWKPCIFLRSLETPYQIKNVNEDGSYVSLFEDLSKDKDIKTHEKYQEFQCLPLDIQFRNFVNALILNEEQLRVRWQLAFDILCSLRLYYPSCQVYVFGSLLTGLGDRTSDVDLYLDVVGDDGAFIQNHQNRRAVIRRLQDEVKTILIHCRCPHTGKPFTNAVTALGTRVPFIRFQHLKSLLRSDITFGSRISVQNSKLLLFYLNYDTRVGPLMVFLRYWAKYHKISGELDIKQYTLSLLVVVYLTNIKIIPSIHFLQKLAAEERYQTADFCNSNNPDQLEGWDASFCENLELIRKRFQPADTGHQSFGHAVLGLITGFCDMFASLDLKKNVVCVLTGDIIDKQVIVNKAWDQLPEPLRGKPDSLNGLEYCRPLCVQDPFVLNFNVGGVAKPEVVLKFQKACKLTYDKLTFGGGNEVQSLIDLFIPISNNE